MLVERADEKLRQVVFPPTAGRNRVREWRLRRELPARTANPILLVTISLEESDIKESTDVELSAGVSPRYSTRLRSFGDWRSSQGRIRRRGRTRLIAGFYLWLAYPRVHS